MKMKKKIDFAKSKHAIIDFPVSWDKENSLYGCHQEIVKGFVRIDNKTYPAVAEVYPSKEDGGNGFIRSIQMDGLEINFSEVGNFWFGPIWGGKAKVKYLS